MTASTLALTETKPSTSAAEVPTGGEQRERKGTRRQGGCRDRFRTRDRAGRGAGPRRGGCAGRRERQRGRPHGGGSRSTARRRDGGHDQARRWRGGRRSRGRLGDDGRRRALTACS